MSTLVDLQTRNRELARQINEEALRNPQSPYAGKFVGIEESRDTVAQIVDQYVDQNATRGKDITINGDTWQVWTDGGGDYGLVRQLTGPSGEDERILVVGSAPDAQIRDLVASLEPGVPSY